MPSHQLKAVFFDAAGTLFTVNGSVGEIYARLAREHGKEISAADLEVGFRRCFAQALAMAFPGAEPVHIPQLEKQWWRNVVQSIFAPLGSFPEFDTYFEALFTYFARTESWQLYSETLDTLTALQNRSVRLGIISNFDSRLFGLLEGLGIAGFFDSVTISTQAGSAKPAPEIFSQALAQHNLRPHEALHIGDSYEADVIGAQASGLTPVFVDRDNHKRETVRYHTVKSLAELPTLVDTYGTRNPSL